MSQLTEREQMAVTELLRGRATVQHASIVAGMLDHVETIEEPVEQWPTQESCRAYSEAIPGHSLRAAFEADPFHQAALGVARQYERHANLVGPARQLVDTAKRYGLLS